ncbi:glycerol-3-phosphate dehydrogenase/oxidase [Leptospira borgpetersenii]|uniref:FAD dependent oxidoreductase n=2 Tax=Leptospira borgpetersenii TaxID=174 RepID=M3HSA6_LEPBO|nr:glycerol-3-phosphate dehydrogenase/oxidase [Leptospira borgpetersenii]EKP12455.1 FAD dependent oxidoreductase [Leptospira borgpetersenii str. 200801926]EMG00941.1 FAD dependent oxidoreductase [Leptospira borgpetersenii str. 200701203]ENO62439.1 FAD dependent oxidoreductase [Leptospira borgpetersenii serovar Mini str. 201000851]
MSKNKKSPSNTRSAKSQDSFVYDLLVIGGGITGAHVLWDSTLRGMKSILLEKNDYASGTSQATSKMIHGGLRYLKNFELGLVRESLRERAILARITPQAVQTMGFLVPIYSNIERLVLKVGMEMYNALSYDRNANISQDRSIPKYSFLSKEQTTMESPTIERDKLKGSYLYYDYLNINPERHTCEFIFSARERGAEAKNYTEVTSITRSTDSLYTVVARDKISGKEISFQTKSVVNATGPWADLVESLAGVEIEKHLVRSKGIHIVTRKICGDKTLVTKKKDGTHLFIIPWRNKTIIGTTDTEYINSPDRFRVTKKDIEELLSEINYSFGYTNLTLNDVDFYYGGLRPLVEDPGEPKSTYNTSRKTEIFDHKESGFPGFFTAMGGKYTTSRSVGEAVVNKVADYLPGNFSACETSVTPPSTGNYLDLLSFIKELAKKFPKLSGESIETIAFRYGLQAYQILEKSSSREEFYTLQNGEKFFESEVRFIANREDIRFATDFFFRRSGVGVPGLPEEKETTKLVRSLAKYLRWNQNRISKEIKAVKERYRIY